MGSRQRQQVGAAGKQGGLSFRLHAVRTLGDKCAPTAPQSNPSHAPPPLARSSVSPPHTHTITHTHTWAESRSEPRLPKPPNTHAHTHMRMQQASPDQPHSLWLRVSIGRPTWSGPLGSSRASCCASAARSAATAASKHALTDPTAVPSGPVVEQSLAASASQASLPGRPAL